MPYIEPDQREWSREGGKSLKDTATLLGKQISNGGDLQYALAQTIQTYMEKTGLRYAHCEDIMGALTGAIREFQRCVVDPYEAQKADDNGPVYDLNRMTRKGY